MYKALAPVSPERHGGKAWRGFSGYLYATGEAVLPLCAAELIRAAVDMPIGFVRQNDIISPVAICSLVPGRNFYVAPDGRWLGGYVPALLRAYPFTLLTSDADQRMVCVDEESGLLLEAPDGEGAEPFFDDQNQPAGKFAQVVNFLTHLDRDRQATATLCGLLDRHGLFGEWPMKVDAGQGAQDVTGILRIDEAQLNQLSDEAFLELRKAGALPFIYTHLLSMQRLPLLSRLAQMQSQMQKAQPTLADAFELPLDDDLEFNFD
jgi:hypothetical protein